MELDHDQKRRNERTAGPPVLTWEWTGGTAE